MDQGLEGGQRDVGDDRGGAGGGPQFFRSLRMRVLLFPTRASPPPWRS